MSPRLRLAATVAGLALVATSLSGCGGTGQASAATPGTSSTSTSTPTETPDTETTPTTMSPPLPQSVKSVAKVQRVGQPNKPSVVAPGAKFNAPVTYPDGVTLVITKAEKGIETGHGPGVMAGRQYVRFTVKLTNGSAKPVNLDQVVVTTTYGASSQLAAPVYTQSAGTYDFTGTIKPGASTTALYAFAVPVKQLAGSPWSSTSTACTPRPPTVARSWPSDRRPPHPTRATAVARLVACLRGPRGPGVAGGGELRDAGGCGSPARRPGSG